MAKEITSLIVIDSSVENYHCLLSGLAIAADVLILDNKLDGVEQITGVLGKKTYTTVHIVAHGSPGSLNLGSSQLSLHSLSYYAQQVRGWFAGLPSTCTLLLYGCNVAQGDAGEEFITKLQQLTGVEIAASQTKTGNAAKGGNWELEYRTSEVELQLAFQPEVMQEYQGVLLTITRVLPIEWVQREPIVKDNTTDISVTLRDLQKIKYTITGGTPVGDNLFFSFSEFNIPGGWSATFAASAGFDNVKNIIIRVTGNDVSSINGLIKSEIPNANIYFINPAGVVFDTGATLQVPGDFHASTADYLQLGENERFYAEPQAGEVPSDAAPVGNGFLDAEIGTVEVFSQDFEVPKTLSLIGGEIQVGNDIDVSSITANNIKIAAVASAGELDFIGTDSRVDVSSFTTLGAINWNSANINANNRLEIISNNEITSNNSDSLKINVGDIYISGTSNGADTNTSNNTSNGIDSNNSGLIVINTNKPCYCTSFTSVPKRHSSDGIITANTHTSNIIDLNEAPSVSDIRKQQDEDTAIIFTAADFINAFNDADGNSLSKIQITSLPNNGILKLGDTAVTLGQEIAVAELENLTFTPARDFTGDTSFGWNGSDGRFYANQPAKVDLNIQSLSTFYELDFESPAHTVGDIPNIGSESDLISEIIFGQPQVVNSMTLLDGNSLEFEGLTSYEQISLQLGEGSKQYFITFDLVTQNLKDSQYSFTMLLDTPEVRNFSVHGGLNQFRVFQPSLPGGSILSFNDNQKYHVDIQVDLEDNLWSIDIDGTNRFMAPIGASEIFDIRFSLAPWIFGAANNPNTKVFLDNVLISGTKESGSSITTVDSNSSSNQEGGSIQISTNDLQLRDDATVTASTAGSDSTRKGAGGNIIIRSNFIVLNQPPSVSDIRKGQDEDTAIVFATADFVNAFIDTDSDSLSKIQITSLPNNGILKLGDTAVTLGQEIAVAELENLTFTPARDFTGDTSFGWNGSDGRFYANQPAKVDLNIQPKFRLSQSDGVFQSNKSATDQIQVRWLQGPAQNYEFGFIPVDDANGGLDLDGDEIIDINPDSPNYETAILSRKQAIFNGNQSNSSNVLTRENAQGDFMVSEGESISQLQPATLITGFNIFYLSDGTQTTFSTDNNSQSIAVSEGTGYNQLQFTDSQGETVSFEISPTPVLVTPGNSTNQVQAEINLSRVAKFQNTVGVYAVDELTGGIDINSDGMIDFKPGDVGYSQAAVERAITLSAPTNGGTSSTTLDLQGGQVLGLFLIADADISNFLSQNPDNGVDGGPLAYFSFTPANPDNQIHIMQLGSGDTNIFGFEDMLGGGDRDFNDIIASVTYQSLI